MKQTYTFYSTMGDTQQAASEKRTFFANLKASWGLFEMGSWARHAIRMNHKGDTNV